MAEILLLQPYAGDWDDLRTSPSLPLGLLHAASFAAQEFDVLLIDQRIDPNWRNSLREAIGPETLAVCFTAYVGPMILSNLEMAEETRKLTDVPFVWGGVHSTLESETTLADPRVDVVVRGEGEQTFLELARALKKRQSLEGIEGVWYKKDGEIRRNPDRELQNLDFLPEIHYHLLDVQRYLPLYRGRKSLYFQSSRGCPNACNYCSIPLFERRTYRTQCADRVLERIRFVVDNFGAEDIYFVDDNFFIDINRDRAIVEGIKDIGITWQIQGVEIVTLTRLDDNFLQLLEKSGLQRLTVGIESGSPRVRKLMGKAGSVEDIEKMVLRLSRYNLLVFTNFMSGIPTETREELKQTIDLLFRLMKINSHLRNAPIFEYEAISGTRTYELAIKHGRHPPESLEEWGREEGWHSQDHQSRSLYKGLYFVSNFLDHKADDYEVPAVIRWLFNLYRPVARWRVKHLYFKFIVERYFAKWGKRLLKRSIVRSTSS